MVKKKRSKGVHISGDVVQGAVQDGIDAILNAHPKFRGAEQYISEHIDKNRLQSGIKRVEEYISREGGEWSEEEKAEFAYKNLADYVSSGEVFDDGAKEVILKKSLEERTSKGWRKSEYEGEKYVDKVGDAFRDLYHMMKSGDYAKRMPDFAKAVGTVYDLGFLESALDVLDNYGLVEEREKREIRENIRKRSDEAVYEIEKEYEKRGLTKKRVAAAILIGLGVGVVASSGAGLTGNVVGVSGVAGNSVVGVAGVFLLIAAWFVLRN